MARDSDVDPSTDNQGGEQTAAELAAEVSRLEAELADQRDKARRVGWRKARQVIAVILASLSVVGAVATTTAFWLHERVLDTEIFVETVRSTLDDPAVTDAVGSYVSEQIFVAVDLESRIEEQLTAADRFFADLLQELLGLGELATSALDQLDPPSLVDLAGPIAATIETPVRNAVNDFVGSAEFRDGLEATIRVAHPAAVALLRGDEEALPNVVVDSGEVRLDLVPLIAASMRAMVAGGLEIVGLEEVVPAIPVSETPGDGLRALADAVGADLPSDFGQVLIMSESELNELQAVMRVFDRLPWLLLILTLVLIASTVAVSTNRRRTVVQLAIGASAGLFIAFIAIRRLEEFIVDSISDPEGSAAARTVLTSVFGSLRLTLVVLTIAALVLGIALVAAAHGWLQAGRKWASDLTSTSDGVSAAQRFTARYADPLLAAGTAVAILTLFFVGIGWPQVVVIGLLLSLLMWWITRCDRRLEVETDSEQALVDNPVRD